MKKLLVYMPGQIAYGEALAFQLACVERLRTGSPEAGGYLILLGHPPVITVGRSGTPDNILVPRERLRNEGIEVFDVSRGGDVTYHGPGQIVGYPIIPLNDHGGDVHRYLRDLEWAIIRSLADFGIVSQRRPRYTGVWVGRDKIAAIGVAITRWVTYHGFALNVAPNLDHFALIRPCGITDGGVTSMEKLLGRAVDRAEVEKRLVGHFSEVFGFNEIEWRSELSLPTAEGARANVPAGTQ